MKFEPSIKPDYILLDVQPRPKITRILQYSRNNRISETRKERPRTLHTLSLNYRNYVPQIRNRDFSTVVSSLRQFKSLEYLSVDFFFLVQSPITTKKFIASLKHLKKLSVLRLRASSVHIPNLSEKMLRSLAQALNQTEYFHHNFQIKLSLWKEIGVDKKEFPQIISSLCEVKRLTLADMIFERSYDSGLHIHELIAGFKEIKSLSKLSMSIIEYYTSPSLLRAIIESLAEVDSLKTSKIHLKRCNNVEPINLSLEQLVTSFKRVVQTQNVEIIFEDSWH